MSSWWLFKCGDRNSQLKARSREKKMGHLRNMLLARTGSGLGAKLRLAWGKIRRFYLGHLRPGYVESKISLRRGECLRCGTCCMLLYRCPELEELPNGTTRCRVHENRPRNCRIFPVDQTDLNQRDLVFKDPDKRPCGFDFVESG